MSVEIWCRTVAVVNTDPLRRCYNGCNFSEETRYGEWKLYQTWETREFAELVVRGLQCDRYEYKIEEPQQEHQA